MSGLLDYWSFLQQRYPDIVSAMMQHLGISLISVALGCLVAIPLGIYLASSRHKWLQTFVFGVANLFQTIPSLALLALMIPLFGIGVKPAVIALFLYSLLPILRNTYTGIQSVDRGVIEAARGMGMSRLQRMLHIELPLAFPYMMSGIRITTVYIISWTTLASMIGAGGLGLLIFSGMGVNNVHLIVSGAVAAIALALLVDFVLGKLEKIAFKRETRIAQQRA
jgi:osmoprotectant transport system permease protein